MIERHDKSAAGRLLVAMSAGWLCIISPAKAGDDPAISYCEAVLLAHLKTPKSYERVDASIVGRSAYIEYDAVNLYNAPVRSVYECYFDYNSKDATFSIGIKDLDETKKEIDELASRDVGTMNADEKAQAREHAQDLKDRLDSAMQQMVDLMLTVMQENLKPISASSTGLSSN